ncbi:hypothetical protein NQ314_010863 [Rhamnusium bicolor]|uniref:Uncharacterized protein n=1 Tax=Rhamnusium bicolor TaxID=1586634 RepID=A0AAV8XN63_9CUCU|nr:hypothetical protein NQ314_010863 [Rhamnusium bicolor]
MKCDIKGFLNNDNFSKIISEAVTTFGATFFDQFLTEIAPVTNLVIKDFINVLLKIFNEQ